MTFSFYASTVKGKKQIPKQRSGHCRLSSLSRQNGILCRRFPGGFALNSEKQNLSGLNREIIACALEQEARFNHLKSERFDPESLWNRVDGDLDLLRELVELFTEEAPRMLARIEEAIEHGSASDLEKASHKIKGSVLQFSAHAATAIALELEENARLGSIAGAEELLKKLRHEIDRLQQTLRAMVRGAANG
jgi:HPt (histidine-containing phosphotransfer) domain-containing protein